MGRGHLIGVRLRAPSSTPTPAQGPPQLPSQHFVTVDMSPSVERGELYVDRALLHWIVYPVTRRCRFRCKGKAVGVPMIRPG